MTKRKHKSMSFSSFDEAGRAWYKDYNKRCNKVLPGSGAYMPPPKRKPLHISFMSTIVISGIERKGESRDGLAGCLLTSHKNFDIAKTAIIEREYPYHIFNKDYAVRVKVPVALGCYLL